MRRTQIYLDEEVSAQLAKRAKEERTTVSDLIRKAVREKYRVMTIAEKMEAARQAWGIWKDRDDIGDSEDYIRKLRSHRSERTKELWKD